MGMACPVAAFPWLPEFTIPMATRVCLQTVHLLSRLAGKIPADGYVSMLGISQGISVSLKVSVLVISRYRLTVVSTNFLCSSFNFFCTEEILVPWNGHCIRKLKFYARHLFCQAREKAIALLGNETRRPRVTTEWRRLACSCTSRTSSRICLR